MVLSFSFTFGIARSFLKAHIYRTILNWFSVRNHTECEWCAKNAIYSILIKYPTFHWNWNGVDLLGTNCYHQVSTFIDFRMFCRLSYCRHWPQMHTYHVGSTPAHCYQTLASIIKVRLSTVLYFVHFIWLLLSEKTEEAAAAAAATTATAATEKHRTEAVVDDERLVSWSLRCFNKNVKCQVSQKV